MAKKIPQGDELGSLIEPDPFAFTNFQREIYASFRAPSISTKPAEWEALARKKVPASNFGYVFGSASTARTAAANREAFDRYRLKPIMLVNATRRDLSVNLFGVRYKSPIVVAPVGVQSIMHKDAEEATARACRAVEVPMILSTAATRTIEQVANANAEGDRWYQLYWPQPKYEDVTVSLLRRAKANGYKVLVVTLDTFTLAWRPTDLDDAYLPFLWGEGCQVGFSDPTFNKIYEAQCAEDAKRPAGERIREAYDLLARPGSIYGAARLLFNAPTIKKSRAWLDVMNSGTYRSWADLEVLRRHWDGPIVLKGIQTVDDARRAVEHGMQGIIVSNHGGRQLDGAIASLDAIAEIGSDDEIKHAVKSSSFTIFFDSGIRSGSDVLKALALGAKAVLVGRPYMYGLAIAGEQGVKHVLQCLLADTDNMLANMGKTSLNDLGPKDLQVFERSKL